MSSIRPKKKLLSCGCFTYNFSRDRCKMHATIEDTNKRHLKQIEKDKIEEMKHKSNPNPLKTTKVRKGTFIPPEPLNERKSALVTSFTPSREQYNEAYDIKAVLKPFVGVGELGKWFMDRKAEMIGICQHCSGKTMIALIDEAEREAKFHYSVCHVLSKSAFPSVATHPDNWIELCYYGNSCHKNWDDGHISTTDLNCFGIVIDKIVKMYPSISPEERRKIPAQILEYVKTDLGL